MLKCEVNEGCFRVEIQGTVMQLSCDLDAIVNAVYNNRRNGPVPEQATVFRRLLCSSAMAPNSPMWSSHSHDGFSTAIPIRKKED